MFFVGGISLMVGCDFLDKPEPLPVYLDISNVKVAVNPQNTQFMEIGVKDLWIDHNADRLGVFNIPSVVPMIPQDDNRLIISAGIFETGLSAFRNPYPFWEAQLVTLNDAEPLDTVPLNLTFNYLPDTIIQFAFVEGFEDASAQLENVRTGDEIVNMRPTRDEKLSGQYSGRAQFSPTQYDFEVVSTNFLTLPQRGANDVYIEITYKNDISFTAGFFYAYPDQIGEIPAGYFFNSNLEWKTVYIHLNDDLRTLPDNGQFKLYIRANSMNPTTGVGQEGVIYLDNIRVVHFVE